MRSLTSAVGANILNVTYGIQVAARDDPWIELAEEANSFVSRSVTGYLVDVLPIRKFTINFAYVKSYMMGQLNIFRPGFLRPKEMHGKHAQPLRSYVISHSNMLRVTW